VELTNIDLEETPNAIVGVEGDKLNAPVNVYSLDGRVVKKATNSSDALNGLDKGVYIFGGKKYLKR
jgi:alpha-amylase